MDKLHIKKTMLILGMMALVFANPVSAEINTTQILDGFNVIWSIVDNIADNFGSIITLVMFGIVIAVTYVFKDFIKDLFTGIARNTNKK